MKIDLKKKVLLFDFDGTIVETERLAQEAISHYFAEKKLLPEDQVLDMFSNMIVGRTWESAVQNMIQHAKSLGITLDTPANLAQEFKQRYRARFNTAVKLIPGFLEILPKIRDQAQFVGIVTGSEHEEVEAILKATGLSGAFQRVWAFGDYEHSKPHPSPYLAALRDLGCDPAQTLVFEDSEAGMESAFQAGLKWVQVCHEHHAKKPDPRSLVVIRDWHELQID